MALTRSLSNSEGHKPKVQVIIQDKIESYLERKFRVSRSYATRESYRRVVHRFIDYIQVQQKQSENTSQSPCNDIMRLLDKSDHNSYG